MKVKIPFYERFRKPMLDDVKTWTSRTRRMGNVGDTFEAFGQDFLIERVERKSLFEIALRHHKDEGCESAKDFVEVWKKIHPRMGYDHTKRVYVHVFRRIK